VIPDSLGTLDLMVRDLEAFHEVYYITSRPGFRVKQQTEMWLQRHMSAYRAWQHNPTVLIVGHRVKGETAKALGLDCYIDDNLDNVNDCGRVSPTTRTYLLDRSYNQAGMGEEELDPLVIRVKTLGEMFDHELGNL
jgi:uncharacterized HAD superfamily protein